MLQKRHFWSPVLVWLLARLATAQVQWWEVSDRGLPSRRGAASCMIDSKYMFVFGGQSDAGTLLSDAWVYSFADGLWDRVGLVGTGPPPRAFATATLMSGSAVLVVGGMCNGTEPGLDATPCADMIWEFSRLSGLWHALAPTGQPTPAPRMGHVAVASADSSLVLYGGATGPNWSMDSSGGLWRLTHAAAAAGSLAAGKAAWAYLSPSTPAAALPSGRLGHAGVYVARSCVFHGGMVLAPRVGGAPAVPGESRDIAIFHLDTLEWEVLGFATELARAWHAMGLYQDRYAVVLGGTTPANVAANLPRRTLLEPRWFDVPNKRWAPVPLNASRSLLTGQPRSRAQHFGAVLEGNAVILGGGVQAVSIDSPSVVTGSFVADTWGLDFTGQRIVRRSLQINFVSEVGNAAERLILFWDNVEEAIASDTDSFLFPSVPVGPIVCAATRYGGLAVVVETAHLFYSDSVVIQVVREQSNRTVAITALMQDGASALPGAIVVANLWNNTGRSWIPFSGGVTGPDGIVELRLVATQVPLVPARYGSRFELRILSGATGNEVGVLPAVTVPYASTDGTATPTQSVTTSVAPQLHPVTLAAANDSVRAVLGPSSVWGYTYLDITIEAKTPSLRPFDRLVFALASNVPFLTLFLSPASADPWPSHLDWFWFTGLGSVGGQTSFWHTLSTLGANTSSDYPLRLRAGVGFSPHSRESLSASITEVSFEFRISVEQGSATGSPPTTQGAAPPPGGSLGPGDQGGDSDGRRDNVGLWLGIAIAIAVFLCCLCTVILVLARRQRRRRHKHVIKEIADVLSDEERFGAIMAKEMDKARRVPPLVSEYGTEMVPMSHVAGKPAQPSHAGGMGQGQGRRSEDKHGRGSSGRLKKEHRRGSGRDGSVPLSTRAGELGSIGGADDVESFMHNLEMMAEEYRRTLLTEDGPPPALPHAAPPLVDVDMHDRYSERERAAAGAPPMVKVQQSAPPAPQGGWVA